MLKKIKILQVGDGLADIFKMVYLMQKIFYLN